MVGAKTGLESFLLEAFGRNLLEVYLLSALGILSLFIFIYDFRFGPNPQSRIRKRLQAYAMISNGQRDFERSERTGTLTVKEHAILLGILKKIEQKSAVLSTIIVFIMAAFLSGFYQSNGHEVERSILGWAAGCIFPAFLAAFVGIRHIDLGHTYGRWFSSTEEHARFIQRQLIDDLVRKECCYKFSWYLVLIVCSLLFFSLGIITLQQSQLN